MPFATRSSGGNLAQTPVCKGAAGPGACHQGINARQRKAQPRRTEVRSARLGRGQGRGGEREAGLWNREESCFVSEGFQTGSILTRFCVATGGSGTRNCIPGPTPIGTVVER